jgi:hypothetical protein
MTIPVENDGKWNIYRDIVQQSSELQKDLREYRDLARLAEAKLAEMHERYFNEYDLPGWMLLKCQLDFALRDPEILGGVLPEEAEKPE